MLTNLLDNAIQFTPTDGSISLTLARCGEGAEIRVTDTGCGIEPELEPKIFDRFLRRKIRAPEIAALVLGWRLCSPSSARTMEKPP